jgi:phosphoenolpyruvate carboxylase
MVISPPGEEMTMAQAKKWSQDVTEHSNAMDLEEHIFESHDPKEIAKSLKHSAEASHRRKSEPYQSAMSMLTFYINRAGKNLPQKRKKVLEKAKDELRHEFDRA